MLKMLEEERALDAGQRLHRRQREDVLLTICRSKDRRAPYSTYNAARVKLFMQRSVSATDWFFEFIVPLLPFDRLQTETVTHYARRLAHAEQPTALVLSLLDIREPAMESQDPLIRRHWCLIHYVLDGHHKLKAAASAGRPITLLSFLNYNWSSSDVLPILDVLAGHPRDPNSYEE